MRVIFKLVLVLVVLVGVCVVGGLLAIDGIARSGIERAATEALGVPTRLASADVGVFDGTFAMSGLTVANPAGFEADHFLRLDDGDVSITLGSLRRDLVELPTLNLDGLDVVLERRAGKSNYGAILEHLEARDPAVEPAPAPEEDGRRFVVRKIVITSVTVRTDFAPVGGAATKLDVPIERIELTDVGTDSDRGVLLAELSDVIMRAVLAAIVQRGVELPAEIAAELEAGMGRLRSLAASGIGVTTEIGDVATELGGAVEAATGRLDAVKDDAERAIDEAGRAIDDAVGGLGRLLGGEPKKKAADPPPP